MDTYSGARAAGVLGTSVPRVVRAVERLGLNARREGSNRLELTQRMVDRLADELGVTRGIEGLADIEVKVLAALARAPFGLASGRVVAGQAGVSPTAATRALRELEDKELICREPAVIAAGRPRRVEILHANRRSPRWSELAPRLAEVHPPRRHAGQTTVPPRLRHLFWNTAPEQLDTRKAGPYIARRLLASFDLDGLAWGAENLRPQDWERAATARGLEPRVRAVALNLAEKR